MARTIGLITELEVVNSVLSVAGDSPVQALTDAYSPVFIIRQMMTNISREMQSRELWFNAEYHVELAPNAITNTIVLPFNLLRFEPDNVRYVARGLTVYDRTARTSAITLPIYADISVQLEFNELPQTAREYIRTACRIQYNNEYFGETSIKQDLNAEYSMAKNNLEQENIENEDINIFDAARISSIAFNNRRR